MMIKKVKEYMSSPIYVIERNEPIQRARNLMFKYGIGRLPVMDGGRLVGIVTKYDITNRLSQAAPEWRRRPIDKVPIQVVMTEKPSPYSLMQPCPRQQSLWSRTRSAGFLWSGMERSWA